MFRLLNASAGYLVTMSIVGCASAPASQAGGAAAEPVAHEYRTGSMMAQKEKHITTDEERKRAQDVAAEIRSVPGAVPSSR